jgi:hypothetical protein
VKEKNKIRFTINITTEKKGLIFILEEVINLIKKISDLKMENLSNANYRTEKQPYYLLRQ